MPSSPTGSESNAGGLSPEERAFCAEAERLGFLTPEKTRECAKDQRKRRAAGKSDPIAFILIEKGYLESDQIQKVRSGLKRREAKEKTRPKPRGKTKRSGASAAPKAPTSPAAYGSREDEGEREDLFAKMAVKLGFISEEDLHKFLEGAKAQEGEEKQDPLGFRLLQAGLLTSHQIRHINEEVKKKVGKPRIAGYELESELGRGAMGVVFKSRQVSLDRPVALKVIPKNIYAGARFKERFFREARTAGRLNHPNIVKAIDAGETGRHYYFVMELFEGKTLLDRIGKKGLPESTALDYAIQVTRALKHAHQAGLVHRDIKPENLLVSPDGKTVKITDMGLAKSTEEKDSSITREGSTVGTPFYISPEQVAARADVDTRADLYALGGTLYHLMTGAPPFKGPSPMLVIKKHLEEKPVPLKIRNPAVSAEMNRIVMKLLEKKREDRYPDPAALLDDLETLRRLGPAQAAARSGAKAPTASTKKPRKKTSSPLIPLAAGGAALLALIVIGLLLFAGGGGDGDRNGERPGPEDDPGTDVGPGDATDPPEDRSQEALQEANLYARDHPDAFEGILARYEAVLDEHPGTPAFASAKDAIEKVKARRLDKARAEVERRRAEAERLAGREEFREALAHLADVPGSLREVEGIEGRLREAEEAIREQARLAVERRIERAEEAAAKGAWEEAVGILEGVEAFGMPGLLDKVKDRVDAYRREKKTAQFREIHTRILDRIAAENLEAGLQLLREQLNLVEDFEVKDRLRRDVINIDRAKGVRDSARRKAASRTDTLTLRLSDGEALAARVFVDDTNLRLKTAAGDRIVPLTDLASPDVHRLARCERLPAACYAWYVNRDLRYVLKLAGGKTEGEGEIFDLLEIALSCERARMHSGIQRLEENAADPSAWLGLIKPWGGIPFFTEREGRLRLRASRSLSGASDPFLFAQGPGRKTDGSHSLAYDFLSPVPFAQFVTDGRGAWSAGWGLLEQQTRQAGLIETYAPGVWSRFRVETEVRLSPDTKGVGFTFHRQADGRRYAFEVRDGKEGTFAAFYFRPPGRPAMVRAGQPLPLEHPDRDAFHTLTLSVENGTFTGGFDGKHLPLGREERQSIDTHTELEKGRLGLRASSPAVFRALRIDGSLDPGWSSRLAGTPVLEALAEKNPAKLFDGISTHGWEVLAGSPRVQGESLRLEGPFTAVRHASGSLFDARQFLQVRFQVQTLDEGAFLVVGFRFQQTCRALAIRPRPGAAYPEALPPRMKVVDVPLGQGWHTFVLVEDADGVALWADRVKVFVAPEDQIKTWPDSRFHLFGLGLASAGGGLEVKDVTATQKSY